ncbi:MAG: redoxin domain-containing (seleno)protein, partial [Acidimicrobiia bacterium]
MVSLVLLDVGQPTEVAARIDESGVWIDVDGVEAALGWELKPEGLCREATCIPVAGRSDLMNDGQMNLEGLADILERPLAHAATGG